ncbi:MAG: endonuclease/exonuclease/phosphatase family protein [Bacteroidota bacterium]
MKLLKFLFQIILGGLAFAAIIPHLFPNYWLADIFSHFKLQYVILLLIILLPASLFLIKKRIFPIVLVFLLLVWNSSFIVPLYLQDSNLTETSGKSLSVLSMNLLASNTNYKKALELIREKDPDVLVVLELSPQWGKQLQELNPHFPFRQMYPQKNNFGIGILSKIPMISSVTDFGKNFPPSILSKLEYNGHPVFILATHPVPPVSQDMFNFRNDQLKEIVKLSKLQNENFILVGDLNTSSYSKHFQKLLENGNFKDSRKGFGIASTWPTDYHILRTTLDHFLLKGEMQVLKRSTEKSIGSDHLPVFLEVGL